MSKPIILYDGECGFCTRSVKLGRRLDWFKVFEWHSRWEPGIQEKFPRVSFDDTLRQMVCVKPDSKVLGGFYCVRHLWLHFPLLFLPALFLYIPGVSLIGVPFYKWIAKNRHRFGGRENCEWKSQNPRF